MTTADLQLEMTEIKTRLRWLETTVREFAGRQQPLPPSLDRLLSNQDLVTWLRAQGLVRDPTAEELLLSAQWDELPEQEKQAVVWELDHLPPGPMVSDIIIEGRR